MKIFQVKAQGDTLYLKASTLKEAQDQLAFKIGDIPSTLLKWTEVDTLPEGEDYL